MSTTTLESRTQTSRESFAFGVLFILAMNILQRLVGLGRNLGFCHFLSDAELGHWALANSFFLIAAPFAVLGLPGSFGKFVEYFRVRGCLKDYVWRIVGASVLGMNVVALVMLCFPDGVSWSIYGELATPRVIAWTALTFLAVTAFNIIYELTISLRHVRAASAMQFIQSAGFAVLGVGGLWYSSSWFILLPSYSVACLLAMVPGLFSIYMHSGEEFLKSESLSHKAMWMRIVPYAATLWMTNFLANSFELVDRYMLLHFCEGGEVVGQRLVGQFYCGRIIPNLLLSLALMLSGILLPYLSADWEAKRFAQIAERMRQVLSLVCVSFLALSVAALLASPVLFDWILDGRYREAESILGIALAQCTFSSLVFIGSTYLMCAEKGRQSTYILAFGLAINVLLNFPMIHYFGLYGSILATWIANGAILGLTLWRLSKEGCCVGWKTSLLCAMPAILLLGVIPASIGLAGLFYVASRTDWLLSDNDRKEVDQLLLPRLAKVGIQLPTLWPSV